MIVFLFCCNPKERYTRTTASITSSCWYFGESVVKDFKNPQSIIVATSSLAVNLAKLGITDFIKSDNLSESFLIINSQSLQICVKTSIFDIIIKYRADSIAYSGNGTRNKPKKKE